MFTIGTYVAWQLSAQEHAESLSKSSTHKDVRDNVPLIQREIAALKAVQRGDDTPYRAYVEAVVAINCTARDRMTHGDFWTQCPGERLAARKKMMHEMRWK